MLFPLKTATLGAAFVLLGACGYVDAYEEAVHDMEPVYCYQSLAGVECFKEPNHQDKRRLVNYYGPHPTRYDAPEKAEVPELQAPEEIEHWVKDPEPVPQPRSQLAASQASRPAPQPVASTRRLSAEDAAAARSLRFTEPEPPAVVEQVNEGGTLVLDGNKARVVPAK